MSTGTLALSQLPLWRRRSASRPAETGLAFDEIAGPLVIACGLVGGAGTTTLAAAIAQQATRESTAPVLLTEREDRGGALATITGVASPAGLTSLATASESPRHAFAELPDGTRVIASRRRLTSDGDDHEAVTALLLDAREAHGLVVVDAGTDDATLKPLVAAATHILWVTRADRTGLAHARAVLPMQSAARQALVVTATRPSGRVPRRTLASVAAHLRERVVVVPYSDAIAGGGSRDPAAALASSLTGLTRFLAR